jgi:hypothetical protein
VTADIPIDIDVISPYDFFQFHIYIGFVDWFGSISIQEDVLVGVSYHHSRFHPMDNLPEVGVDLDSQLSYGKLFNFLFIGNLLYYLSIGFYTVTFILFTTSAIKKDTSYLVLFNCIFELNQKTASTS